MHEGCMWACLSLLTCGQQQQQIRRLEPDSWAASSSSRAVYILFSWCCSLGQSGASTRVASPKVWEVRCHWSVCWSGRRGDLSSLLKYRFEVVVLYLSISMFCYFWISSVTTYLNCRIIYQQSDLKRKKNTQFFINTQTLKIRLIIHKADNWLPHSIQYILYIHELTLFVLQFFRIIIRIPLLFSKRGHCFATAAKGQ